MSDSEEGEEGEEGATPVAWVISILATLLGAALLALSMVMQRYALSFPEPRVPFGRFRVPRNVAWVGGLVLYGLANGAKILGFNLGPMTVLASVFTSLLVFNLIFARWLLKEEVTVPKVVGAAFILVGACICTAGSPTDAKTEFTPEEIAELFGEPAPHGWWFVGAMIVIVSCGAACVFTYERRFPRQPRATVTPSPTAVAEASERHQRASAVGAGAERSCGPGASDGGAAPGADWVVGGGAKWELSASPQRRPSAAAAAAAPDAAAPAAPRRPPPWLDAAMAIIYPATLGLDEAVSDLFVRAYSAMLVQCTDSAEVPCAHWALYVCLPGGCLAGLASLVFMRIVFARYDTTVALPIEYGALNAGNVGVGLLFYTEHRVMKTGQIALALAGTATILFGIGVGRISSSRCRRHAPCSSQCGRGDAVKV